MPGQTDDTSLLKSAKAGDAEAFGALYERYAPAVFRYLAAHLPSGLDAEDLTSEVFLRTWQSLPNYHERGVPFLAFLLRIARNALIDRYRRGRLGQSYPADLEPTLMDEAPGPAETLAQRLDQQEMAQVLARLSEDYRTVLVLRFINELSPQETAQVMKRSAGAVRVLQHRALAALRRLME
jgi:RNA polymerase sigma-70 factor (ECF subfamily)